MKNKQDINIDKLSEMHNTRCNCFQRLMLATYSSKQRPGYLGTRRPWSWISSNHRPVRFWHQDARDISRLSLKLPRLRVFQIVSVLLNNNHTWCHLAPLGLWNQGRLKLVQCPHKGAAAVAISWVIGWGSWGRGLLSDEAWGQVRQLGQPSPCGCCAPLQITRPPSTTTRTKKKFYI